MPYRFKLGAWAVDAELNTICRDGRTIRLEPKVMELCSHMAGQPGHVLRKEELIRSIWPDTFVTEDVLTHAISELRRALGDDAKCSRYIETIPKRGYRLIAPVKVEQENRSDSRSSAIINGSQDHLRQAFTRRSWKRGFLLAGVFVTALSIVAVTVRRDEHDSRPTDQNLVAVPIVTYADGAAWLPALSPDGTRVAYSWSTGDEFAPSWYLEVKVIGSETRTRLTQQAAAFPPGPAWSRDGSEIAFVRAGALDDRGIFVISAMGGPERKLRSLAPERMLQRVVSWSPDGRWIAFADEVPRPSNATHQVRGPSAIYL